jgi:thiamine transporter ThiT
MAARTEDSYGSRYRRRWRRTALVMATIGAFAYSQGSVRGGVAALIEGLVAFISGGLITGSLVNLLVAAFPSRRRR